MPIFQRIRLQEGASLECRSEASWSVLTGEGTGGVSACREQYALGRGEILCLPPDTEYVVTAERDLTLYLASGFDKSPADAQTVQALQDDDAESCRSLLDMACRLQETPGIHSAVSDMLADALRYMLAGWLQSAGGSGPVRRLSRMLEENYANPEFSIAAAIDTIPFCRDHIRRLFKNETGLTPVAYLTRLRMERARRLLRQQADDNRSVSEIAYLCGFYDARYFARQFKQVTGMTPREYALYSAQTKTP